MKVADDGFQCPKVTKLLSMSYKKACIIVRIHDLVRSLHPTRQHAYRSTLHCVHTRSIICTATVRDNGGR